MESYRSNKFLFVTSVLSMIILLIGTTFSYFTISTQSETDALAVKSEKIELGLSILPLYTGHKLIPTNDKDIMLAYENKCVDLHNYGACLAYDIEVVNYNKSQDMIGKIDFEVEGIDNLSYIILDENNNIYQDKKNIANGVSVNMPLGEHFILGDAINNVPTKKKFVLLIWLTNLDKNQNETDAGGNFTASVSYSAVAGSKISGSINGFGDNSVDEAELRGE